MAEDRKFEFRDGAFYNRVSGEMIPLDEPVIIFRARDKHALQVLYYYQRLCSDEHHQCAIEDRIHEFQAFRENHPLKEPGVTRHIVLNSEMGDAALTSAGKSETDRSGWIVLSGDGKRYRTWKDGGSAWTESRDEATRYARRVDAEAVHAEDEDAWSVEPFAGKSEIGGES